MKPIIHPCEGSIAFARFERLQSGAMRADELRVSGVFVNDGDDKMSVVLSWTLESVLTGRTERGINLASESDELRFRSVEDAAYAIRDIARNHFRDGFGVTYGDFKADDILEQIRIAIVRDPRPGYMWVSDFAGVTDEHYAKYGAKNADAPEAVAGAKSIGEQVKVAAKAHKATRGTKKEKMEAAAAAVDAITAPVIAATAGEPPALPVVNSVEIDGIKMTEPAPVHPTHFRGVLLRPASDWADPNAEGVFVGVSNADYHADKLVVGGSGLGDYLKSAAHAKIEKSIPARSRDIGTLVHGDVLENKDAAALGFAVVEGKTTTKENTVTTDMVRIAKACAVALREDEHTAKVATLPGLRELSCRVRCPESGLMLKCRFDLAPDAGGWAWDIKTTSSEDPGEFAVSFGNFGYSLQAAHYLRVAALLGLPFRAMAFACVSTEAPFEVWLVKFGPVAGCEELHGLATRAAIEACKIEAKSRAEGRWGKRKHAPIVAELKSWHLTALRQLANGEGVPH